MLNYRISALKKAGFSKFPATTDEFLEYAKATKRNGHAGRHGARPRLRRRQRLGALVPVGARRQLVDAEDKVILNSPETEKALNYAKQLYENMIPGVASWNDAFNNKAFLAGEIHWTNNGISIYVAAAKRDPTKKEIAEDMDHAFWPVGPVGKPTELHVCCSDPGDDLHQVSAGLKALIAFMLEADQFNKWLERVGRLPHPLPQRL